MLFSFNLYSSLLLPAFVQGIVFAALLVYRGSVQEKLSDKLLAALLLLNSIRIAFWMLGFAGWYDSHDAYTSFMFYFPFNNVILTGPLLYFYFLSLSNHEFRFEKKHLVHLIIPSLWILLIVAKFLVDFSFYYPFPVTASSQFGTKGPFADFDKSSWIEILSYLIFFYYLLLTIRLYRRYRQYVVMNFSSTEEIRFDWLRNILYAIAGGVIIFFGFNIMAYLQPAGNNSYVFDWYAYLFLGLITYYISIAGYYSNNRLMHKLNFKLAEEKETVPAVTGINQVAINDWTDWKQKISVLMEDKKPYLEPDLTLSDLARQLSTNPALLSKIINESMGMNFNDFINSYRVKEVVIKLKTGEQKTQTLLGIAYDCGFNSKATFNRAFKKFENRSPKEYTDTLESS